MAMLIHVYKRSDLSQSFPKNADCELEVVGEALSIKAGNLTPSEKQFVESKFAFFGGPRKWITGTHPQSHDGLLMFTVTQD